MPDNATPHHSPAPSSPFKVALAIAIFFPYGFYLLWKHPTLGNKPGWWIGGIAYVVFAMAMAGMSEPTPTPSKKNNTSASGSKNDGPSSVGRQSVKMLSRVKKKMSKDKVRSVCGRNPSTQMALGKGEMWLVEFDDGSTLHVTFDKFGEVAGASDVTNSK